MNKLHRFAADGRYLGFIVQDRPMEEYAPRTDLTLVDPPDVSDGHWQYWTGSAWEVRVEPPPPSAPPPAPAPPPEVAGG